MDAAIECGDRWWSYDDFDKRVLETALKHSAIKHEKQALNEKAQTYFTS
jgi:hypothetical protein